MTASAKRGVMVFQIPCPDPEVAAQIGAALVEERLAACTHVCPPHDSRYWWDGAVVCEAEATLLAKSRPELAERLAARVTELHPYELPAILGTRTDFVTADFAEWVAAETR